MWLLRDYLDASVETWCILGTEESGCKHVRDRGQQEGDVDVAICSMACESLICMAGNVFMGPILDRVCRDADQGRSWCTLTDGSSRVHSLGNVNVSLNEMHKLE